jgi:hypothetical protein
MPHGETAGDQGSPRVWRDRPGCTSSTTLMTRSMLLNRPSHPRHESPWSGRDRRGRPGTPSPGHQGEPRSTRCRRAGRACRSRPLRGRARASRTTRVGWATEARHGESMNRRVGRSAAAAPTIVDALWPAVAMRSAVRQDRCGPGRSAASSGASTPGTRGAIIGPGIRQEPPPRWERLLARVVGGVGRGPISRWAGRDRRRSRGPR